MEIRLYKESRNVTLALPRDTRRPESFAAVRVTVARAVSPQRTMKDPEIRVLFPKLAADDTAVRRKVRASPLVASLPTRHLTATVRFGWS